MIGNTDRPVELLNNDEFQIESYVTGLAEFIEECDTPMTIAVQGDWGCGKTSMMNMIRSYLKEKKNIADVWFNTWQFSQFNMDDQLALTFLQHMINELSKGIADTDIKKKVFEKFTPIIKDITVGMTRQFIGGDIGDVVDNVLTRNKLDIVDEVSQLKSNFQELILKATNDGEKRVVVFIDDLDRLQPVRAVELLEILKLFVDCDNCVFVMAIDTSVVFQGIREKYGHEMSDEKAQSFFDKIIQMPFKMPVAYYRLDGMLERLLSFLQEESLSQKEKEEYINLFKKISNGNPRSLKRLANSILLTEKVAEKKHIYANEEEDMKLAIRRILVTLACIQLQYESTYNFLVNDMYYKKMDKVLALKVPDADDSQRGEEIINSLVQIGMPRPESLDKLTFYDVMVLYKKTLKEYISCADKHKILQKTAVEQLMKIVTLGNVIGDSGENKAVTERSGYAENDRKETDTSEVILQGIPSKLLYLGMCANGQHTEVYKQLTQCGLYLPLKWVERQSDGHKSLEEYRVNLLPLEDFVLYRQIDEVLSQYGEKQVKQVGNDIQITYSHLYKDDTITARFTFRQDERVLYLEGTATGRSMRPMEQTSVFVDKLYKEYQNIQEEYSDKLIEDIAKGAYSKINADRDQNGGITKLSFADFPILNEALVDVVIDYFTFVFKNMEQYYQGMQFGYNMNKLMDAANMSGGEYQ